VEDRVLEIAGLESRLGLIMGESIGPVEMQFPEGLLHPAAETYSKTGGGGGLRTLIARMTSRKASPNMVKRTTDETAVLLVVPPPPPVAGTVTVRGWTALDASVAQFVLLP